MLNHAKPTFCSRMLALVGLEFLIEASAFALPEATDLDLG